MTCALGIFSVLDNFCQIASLHSNSVWMTRILHLICKAHTHILRFGSKFISAMYAQMLDIYRKYWKNLISSEFLIFSKISLYFPTRVCDESTLTVNILYIAVLCGGCGKEHRLRAAAAVWYDIRGNYAVWLGRRHPTQVYAVTADH